MATNSKYALLKQLRKTASLQLGPQSGGGGGSGGAGGAGGKIPAGFLAGMNQKRDEEALAAKEESETAQARAMDDAAKQQDMQIKQVEMEQRMRDQTSQKMQEMQQEHSRLSIESTNLKEQLKNKDLMHKEQLKHMNELVKQQLNHQKMLDKQTEAHRDSMTTPFSTTLVSRSKSLRSLVEKMHKNASQIVPPINAGAGGPMDPKSVGASKIKVDTSAKTPLHTAQNPAAYGAPPAQPSVSNAPVAPVGQPPAPQPTAGAQPPTQPPVQSPAPPQQAMTTMPQFAAKNEFNHPLTNVADRMTHEWNTSEHPIWNSAKNLRSNLNQGFNDYYKANNLNKGNLGDGSIGGMWQKGLAKVQQAGLNVLAYPVSAAAQGLGHSGEHFKDVGNRWSAANDTYNKGIAEDVAAREKGQQAIDEQWNKDVNGGGYVDALWNYMASPNKGKSALGSDMDVLGRRYEQAKGYAGAAGSALKGTLNLGTTALDTAWNLGKGTWRGLGSLVGATAVDDNTQSTGWGMNTDAENQAQASKVEEDKKKILAQATGESGEGSPTPGAAPSFIPGAHGMNDAMRLQQTGYYHPGYINNPAQGAVDPITGMLLSPFTQTSGFDMGGGGYNPEDMLGAFQNSVFDSRPGFNGAYNTFDQAFLNSQRR